MKAKVLIADDSAQMRMILKEILVHNGCEITDEAENGKEAVEMYSRHKPDVVILDLSMPVMDGIEALKEIRRHTTQLPVIMQTAYAFDTDRRIAEEAGCNGFITKPVMPRELKMYLDMSLKKA